MWLYDNSLSQLEYDDDGIYNYSSIERSCDNNALSAGTYYVKIDEYNQNDIIPYYDIALTTTPCSPILAVSPPNLNFNGT